MSYRLSAVVSVLVLAAAVASACSKFGADGEGTADDGGSDQSSPPPEDPTAQADAAPSASCQEAGFDFCDDFERDIVKGSWRAPSLSDGGGTTLSTSTKAFVSPSRSLEVSIPSGDAGSLFAYLSRRLDAKSRKFRVSFALRCDAVGPDVQIFNIGFAESTFLYVTLSKDAEGQAILRFSEQRLKLPDGGSFNMTQRATVISVGQWHGFELSVDVASKAVALTRDDNVHVEKLADLKLDYGDTDVMRIGATFVGGPRTDVRTLFFDDVSYAAR